MTYELSSQRTAWTFSAEQLATKRTEASQKGRADLEVSQMLVRRSPHHPLQATIRQAGIPVSPSFLTEVEEKEIFRFYLSELSHAWRRLEAPDEVLGAASVFFHRFYLRHSVHVHDPSLVMYSCLFLACKCEEFNPPLEKITRHASRPGETRAYVLKSEVLLLEALQYNLVVYSCFRPLRGLIADLHVRFPALLAGTTPTDVYKAILPLLHTWLIGDVILRYPPSQIALASLRRFFADQGSSIDMFLTSLLELQGGSQSLASLHARLDALEATATSSSALPSPQRATVGLFR
jgi:cyclin H